MIVGLIAFVCGGVTALAIAAVVVQDQRLKARVRKLSLHTAGKDIDMRSEKFYGASYVSIPGALFFEKGGQTKELRIKLPQPFWPLRIKGGSGRGFFGLRQIRAAGRDQFINGGGKNWVTDTVMEPNGIDLQGAVTEEDIVIEAFSTTANDGTPFPESGLGLCVVVQGWTFPGRYTC